MKMQLRLWMILSAISLSALSCASDPIHRELPPMKKCVLGPIHAKCHDSRSPNEDGTVRIESLIGYVCLPGSDFLELTDQASE